MARQTRRYTVTKTGQLTCTLTVHEDCVLGEEGAVFEFWASAPGGYVHDVSDPRRPGTLGPQVCDGLCSMGNTMSAPMKAQLAARIRRHARNAIRQADREQAKRLW